MKGAEPEEGAPGPMDQFAVWAGTLLAAMVIRLLRWTSRVEYHGRDVLDGLREDGGRVLLAFWHEQLLLMPYVYPGPRITVMVSKHQDGEWIARTVERFGIHSTRGSSTRGGTSALRALVRRVRAGWDGAFTPDGPRGPRRKAQPGVILAARLCGAPILPVALGCSRARRLASWDRFLLPLPFGKVAYVYGEPLRVPPTAGEGEIERLSRELETALNELSNRAEALALGERPAEDGRP